MTNYEILTFIGIIALFAALVWAAICYLCYAVRSQVLGATDWRGNSGGNSVALTFDDGPAPDTPAILDFLRDENIKATFFLIGSAVEKYPEIAKRIAKEGHEIGNHSYSHPIYLFCTPQRTRRELEMTQAIIEKTVGYAPKLARPPCGVRTPAYFAAAKNLGLQTVQWSDAGFDWQNISAAEIAGKILETVQSDSIILLHDGDAALENDRRETVKSLPLILKGLRAKNLSVAPLAELIGAAQTERTNYKGDFNSVKT
ncbi:MAG: polysaccharide deacetylase family protein [Pyrinomonadaceae bacterium]